MNLTHPSVDLTLDLVEEAIAGRGSLVPCEMRFRPPTPPCDISGDNLRVNSAPFGARFASSRGAENVPNGTLLSLQNLRLPGHVDPARARGARTELMPQTTGVSLARAFLPVLGLRKARPVSPVYAGASCSRAPQRGSSRAASSSTIALRASR